MEITVKSRVREILRDYPGARELFEQAGLMGCAG